MGGSRWGTGGGDGGSGPTPEKLQQVAIGFLRNTGTDSPCEAVGPLLQVHMAHTIYIDD